MVKIAIPVSENLLSEKFGDCSHYEIIEIEKNTIKSRMQGNPPKKISGEIYDWIAMSGITDVIVHHIDRTDLNFFADTKINLFIGIKITSPEIIIDEYLKGTLKSDAKTIQQ